MIGVDANKAIQFEQGICALCKGTGLVDVCNRNKLFRGENPDARKMKCPQCGGKGRAGLRVKS